MAEYHDVYLVGFVLYAGALLLLLSTTIFNNFTRKRKKESDTLAKRVRHVFRIFLYLFLTVRILWTSMHLWGSTLKYSDPAAFVMNRAAIVTFFTSFTLILFYWAERFHKNYYESTNFLPRLGGLFVFINVVVYIAEIVILSIWVAGDEQREGNPLYEINIVLDIVLSFCVSVGFVVYGLLLFCKSRDVDVSVVESKQQELYQILAITTIFTCCFSCRVVLFLYRPLTDKWLPEGVFFAFAYYVPELLPCLLQVWIAETTVEKQEQDSAFIEDLYKNEEDSDSTGSRSSFNSDLNDEQASLLSFNNKRDGIVNT